MLKKINLIISREYLTRVRKKSFIIISILTPLCMLLLMAIPTLMQFAGSETTYRIAVVDESDFYGKSLTNNDDVEFVMMNDNPSDSLKYKFMHNNYNAYLHITGAPDNSDNVTLYSETTLPIDIHRQITDQLAEGLRSQYIDQYKGDKAELDSIINRLSSAQAYLTAINISETGEEKEDSAFISSGISLFAALLIYFIILLYGNMVLNGVIEEKRNRIVEVLISSVTPFELMMGKIIGIALVALTQILIWVVLVGIGLLVMTLTTGNITEAATTTMPGSENIINQLMLIDFNTIFTCSLIYFIFGYLLYASFYAWIGSTLENPSEGQQITLIATLPLCISLYIALYIMQDPESSIVWWASMIPITSPVVMIARLPYGVPTWELITSIMVLIASFVGSTWIAARIYRITILMYGKNVTIKEILKHLRKA